MESAAYAAEAAIEADHWWFVGRRLLFSDVIKGFGLPRDAEILDVGTSTGTNLRLLTSPRLLNSQRKCFLDPEDHAKIRDILPRNPAGVARTSEPLCTSTGQTFTAFSHPSRFSRHSGSFPR